MDFASKVVVIDNGTGYTKMGYAGNLGPDFDIPTLITDSTDQNAKQNFVMSNRKITETLDFQIGEKAAEMYNTHKVVNPIEGGVVRNWDLMEKFWHRSIFDYLRCDPEETVFILTEPPVNPPQNRENVAEIMFETFNAKGIYIGVQAVLALISADPRRRDYTGTVLDSGDGVTHIIPVVDGFVINSCIKHIPLAGSNMTAFIGNMLRERNERCPVGEVNRVAKIIKEKHCYVAENGDLLAEYANFDNRMKNQNLRARYDKYVEGVDPLTKNPYKVSVGPETFLAPEMFFNPEIIDERYRMPIDQLLDRVIQLCPIDTRRRLYKNIALSGGSTLFKNLNNRLQRGVQKKVNNRLQEYQKRSGAKSTPIDVKVLDNPFQRYAVWQGGSILAGTVGFQQCYHTRSSYYEIGPSICRYNAVYSK